MSLRSNTEFMNIQSQAAYNNIQTYEQVRLLSVELDDPIKMTQNIDEAKRKFHELESLDYNGFNSSSIKLVYETYIEDMTTIMLKKDRKSDEVLQVYEMAKCCDEIFTRFRGEGNEN
ncbi:hypothetical protein [Clostridium sp.]|nr:hypothetical protein [Clostridium sp.]MDU2106184.1 hypothetical protein [Clostridium sp.]MDU3355224.1 hypothetical protein [Clostridium sp.]